VVDSDYASLDALIRQVIPRELHALGVGLAARDMDEMPPLCTAGNVKAGAERLFAAGNLLADARRHGADPEEASNLILAVHLVTRILARVAATEESPS
jgi:hypothetical protein